MFDWNDADDAVEDAALFGPGGCLGLIFIIVVALLVFSLASKNEKTCLDTKQCPAGMTLRLQNHECECTTVATDKSQP